MRYAEYSSEGTLAAHIHPFLSAVSSKNLLRLRWSRDGAAPLALFFRKGNLGGIRVVLGPCYSNFDSIVVQTANANDHQHRLPDFHGISTHWLGWRIVWPTVWKFGGEITTIILIQFPARIFQCEVIGRSTEFHAKPFLRRRVPTDRGMFHEGSGMYLKSCRSVKIHWYHNFSRLWERNSNSSSVERFKC